MRKDLVGLGLIGCGGMGQGHLGSLKHVAEARVVAVADPHETNRSHAVAQYVPEAKAFSDYRELLELDEVDAVLIAIPNSLHAEATIASLEAGKHVLCEKPMATTVTDCDRMIDAAQRSAKVLQIGLELRYSPVFRKMEELAGAKVFGEVCMMWCREFREPFGKKVGDWMVQQRFSGGSLNEKDCHHFDLFNWIIGAEPVSVFASGGSDAVYADGGENMGLWRDRKDPATHIDVLDNAFVIVDYSTGARACLALCFFAPGVPLELEAVCPDGRMVSFEEKLQLTTFSHVTGERCHYDFAAGTQHRALSHGGHVLSEQRDFVRCLLEGDQPMNNGHVGKWASVLPLAAELSVAEKRVVTIAEMTAEGKATAPCA